MTNLIIVRGSGDLATGTIYKLKKSGFPVWSWKLPDLLPFGGMWLFVKPFTREHRPWRI